MRVDPKAPGDSPFHPSNITDGDGRHSEIPGPAEQMGQEWIDSLSRTHLTEAERDSGELGGDALVDTLMTRVDALVEFLKGRENDAELLPPMIVDWTGDPHVLVVNDDGSEASWEPIEGDEHEMPDKAGRLIGDEYDSMTVAELGELLKFRELPHTGVKADLIARLRDNDAAKRSAKEAEGVVMVAEGDDLESALAELDAIKGNK